MDEIHPPSAPHAPAGMPAVAWHDYSNSLGAFSDVHKNDATGELGRINFTFPDNFALEARRGYYASVSHVDHQLGRVLRELERLGMAGDTIVSFIGRVKILIVFFKKCMGRKLHEIIICFRFLQVTTATTWASSQSGRRTPTSKPASIAQ